MQESPSAKAVGEILESSEDLEEMLDATKEALVETMNRFSIPPKVMFDVAFTILREAPEYQKQKPGVSKEERREHIEHLVDAALGAHGYNTQDIFDFFRESLHKHLP